jgi:hypothetical protein
LTVPDRRFESRSLQQRVRELSVPENQAINPRNNLLRRAFCPRADALAQGFEPSVPWGLAPHRSVDRKHPAAERGGAPRDFAADVAETNDADSLAADLPTHRAA